MDAVLAAAVLAPLTGAVATAVWRAPAQREAVARTAAVAAGALWLGVLAGDGGAVGRFSADGPTAAAGAGAALLVAVMPRPGTGALVALAAAAGGVAAAHGGGHAGDALAGMAVAVVAGWEGTHFRSPRPWTTRWREVATSPWRLAAGAPWAMAGLAAVAAGAARLHDESGTLTLAAAGTSRLAGPLITGGLAALALAAARRPLGTRAVLLPAALALALRAAGPAGASAAALAFASAASVAAWGLPRGLRQRHRAEPAGALALWCVAAAFAGAAGAAPLGAAPLLGAAAVLTAAVGLVPAVSAAVPAAAALAMGLRDDGSSWALALGLLAVTTAAGLVATPPRRRRRRRAPLRAEGRVDPDPVPPLLRWLPTPRPVTGTAAGLAGWLLVAPGTWGWAGPVAFGAWSRTAVVGVGAAAVALVAAARAGVVQVADLGGPAPLPAEARGPAPLPALPQAAIRVRTAAVVACMGIATAWLVLSLVRGR